MATGKQSAQEPTPMFDAVLASVRSGETGSKAEEQTQPETTAAETVGAA